MKHCRNCLIEKTQDSFVKSKVFSSGYDTICLECSRNRVKTWRKDNPEKRKEQLKRESLKDYNHNKHLKNTYGISRDDYLKMFEQQEGNCNICGKNQLEFTKRLFVDHCHSTGKIRGLLCHNCNTLLGSAKDKVDVLEKAINYLKNHYGI